MTICILTKLRSPVSVSSLMYAPPQSIPSWKFTSYLEAEQGKTSHSRIILTISLTVQSKKKQISPFINNPYKAPWTIAAH